jgi:hypothetical protein
VCVSFWGVEQIQNGDRCHGNKGAKNVKFKPFLITKSTTLSDDLFLCQVSKGSAVRFEFNIFCTFVTMATVAILNLKIF